MAVPTVEIDRASLRRLERRLAILGDHVLVAASRDAAGAAGHRAQVMLRVAFQRDIEGGPAAATQVRPGSPSSSVLVDHDRKTADGVSVDLRVSRLAARWLQFQLGDRRVRNPGTVGVATRANFVPQQKAMRRLGIRLPHGNLPRGRLRKLVTLTENTTASDDEYFYGRPRGPRGAIGFYKRTGRDSAPKLLIAAAKRSKYKNNDRLQRSWNTSVERAGGRMTDDAAIRIMRYVRRMGRSPV